MTWRELWRRFINVLKPAPLTCPCCREPDVTCTEYYAAKGLISQWWRCNACGFRFGGIAPF